VKFLEFQQFATQLVSHPNLLDVATQLENDDQVFTANEADAKPFLANNGFFLPEGATISISRGNSISFAGCINEHCLSVTISIDIDVT
jgi:hypothetical protein